MAELATRDPRLAGAGRHLGRPERRPGQGPVRPAPRGGGGDRAWRRAAASATSATRSTCPACPSTSARPPSACAPTPSGRATPGPPAPSRPASTTPARPRWATSSWSSTASPSNGKTLDTATVVQKGNELRRERNGPTRFSQARPAAPAHAHGGQPAGGVPPAHHRPVPAGVRVLHRRRRAWPGWSAPAASCSGCYGAVAAARPGRGRSPCSCCRSSPSPSTSRPACPASGPASASSASWWRRSSSTTACRCRGSPCWPASAVCSWPSSTGMPAMVRTRFATPTIGREWMIGEMGEAVVAVDPEGVVEVRGAQWRARTNRATPDRRRRAHPGGGHRRRHARGRARDGRGRGLPRARPPTPCERLARTRSEAPPAVADAP